MHGTDGSEVLVNNATAIVVAVVVAVVVSVGVSLSWVAVSSASVDVGVGKLSGRVGGIWVGAVDGGRVSARASEMPPSTKTTETMAMMTPPPNWRKACIIL